MARIRHDVKIKYDENNKPVDILVADNKPLNVVRSEVNPVTGGIRKFEASGRNALADIGVVKARRRLAVIGDSFSAPTSSLVHQATCWWVHSLAELGWPYELVAVSAVAGRTTAQMLAAFDAEVAPHEPDEIWILAGQNDRGGVEVATAALGSLASIIDKAKLIGVTKIVCGTPCDVLSPSEQSRDSIITYTNGLYDMAASGAIDVADTWGAYKSVDTSTGGCDSTLHNGDNQHPNNTGSRRIGSAFASAVSPSVLAKRSYLSAGGALDRRDTTDKSNVIGRNLIMLGTGGTKSAGVTGNVPDDYAYEIPSGATATISVVKETLPRARKKFRQVLGGTIAGTDYFLIKQSPQVSAFSISEGDDVQLRFSALASNLSANFVSLTGSIIFFNSEYAQIGMCSVGGGGSGPGELSTSAITLETPKLACPAGAAYFQFYIAAIYSAGAVTGTFDLFDIYPTVDAA